MGKIIAFDLDDTLCYRPAEFEHLGKDKYNHCLPIQHMIDILNEQYDKGHTIYIYTARGMTTYEGNVQKIYENLYELTLKDLKKWGVRHNGLFMGKLHYHLLIDDKCANLDNAVEMLSKL